MSLSSFCVVSNALRLNWFKLYDGSRDKKQKVKSLPQQQTKIHNAEMQKKPENEERKEKEEEPAMTKTMKIEGMMCGHCEARVKKVLEALPQVDEAAVSHEAGTAVLTLNAEVDNDVLKKAVEDQDYKVIGIE